MFLTSFLWHSRHRCLPSTWLRHIHGMFSTLLLTASVRNFTINKPQRPGVSWTCAGKADRPFSSMFHDFPHYNKLHQSWAHLAIRLLHTNPAKGSSLGLAMALPLLDSKLAHTPSGWNRGIVVVAVGLHSPYSSCTSRCRLQRWDGAVSKRLLVAKELRCNGCICSSAEKSQQQKGKHCTNTAQYSINGTNTLRSIVECSVKLDAKLHISNTYHILMQTNLYCV